MVTLKTDMVNEATASILEMHSIPAQVSKDLFDLLPDSESSNPLEQTMDV